jgi:hypothetical protein
MRKFTPDCATDENPYGCEEENCQACCPHDVIDHGYCLYCEKDCMDDLVIAAEYAFEGDR